MTPSSKSIVRSLLKAVRRNVTIVTDNPQWRDYVVSQVRSAAHEDAKVVQQRLTLAHDLAFLFNNIKTHKVPVLPRMRTCMPGKYEEGRASD